MVSAIDFDLLRQELSDHLVEGPQERFRLDWPGKREAAFAANAPIAKTLRPDRAASVDFDTTKNLFIEGDNLDALKLLQEPYLGSVKLIYIDPPYNTGNDFIYNDDFAETSAEYLQQSGQVDDVGNRLTSNSGSNGRFHSDWLSMMLPRLKLARNLLTEDGVILISIGGLETPRVEQLLSMVFGEGNLLGRFVWTYTQSANQGAISSTHEHVVAATKSASAFGQFKLTAFELEKLGETVTDACFRAVQAKNPASELEIPAGTRIEGEGTREIAAGELSFGVSKLEFLDSARFEGGFLVEAVRLRAAWTMKDQCVAYFDGVRRGRRATVTDTKGQPLEEIFFNREGRLMYRKRRSAQSKVSSHIHGPAMTYSRGRQSVSELFGGLPLFSYPKPVALIERLVALSTDGDDVVLDFFAGSSTTGHAVLAQNAADGGSRRFIMVQLDEVCHPDSEAAKAGFPDIAELSRERIRRAGHKVKEESGVAAANLDIGFRALRIDSTNMADVALTPDVTVQTDLESMDATVKSGRGSEDLLFETLLRLGLDVALPIAQEEIESSEIFVVESGVALVACFAATISESLVRALALRVANLPVAGKIVFRDAAFVKDADRINAEQIFSEIAPSSEIITI